MDVQKGFKKPDVDAGMCDDNSSFFFGTRKIYFESISFHWVYQGNIITWIFNICEILISSLKECPNTDIKAKQPQSSTSNWDDCEEYVVTDSGNFHKEPQLKSVTFSPIVERTIIPLRESDNSSDSSSDSSSSSDSDESLSNAEKQVLLTEEVRTFLLTGIKINIIHFKIIFEFRKIH